nr:MAG TPA_asm: hypothetical protein [Caudoviricetes sp.]
MNRVDPFQSCYFSFRVARIIVSQKMHQSYQDN